MGISVDRRGPGPLRSARVLWLWMMIAFRASPGLTAFMCVTTVVSAALAPFSVYGVKLAVDAVTQQTSVVPGLVIIAVVLLCTAVSGAIAGPTGDTLDDKVFLYVHDDLIRLTAGLPGIGHHEHPALADRVALIERDAYSLVGVWRMFSMIGAIAGSIALVTMLATVSPWLILLLVLALGVTAIQAFGHVQLEKLWKDHEKFRRLGERVIDVLSTITAGVEVRAFGLSRPLLGVAAESHEARHRPWEAVSKRFAGWGVIGWTAYGVGFAAAVVWLLGRAAAGDATVGDVTLLVLIGPQVNTTAQSITSSYTLIIDTITVFSRYQWLRDHAREHDWSESTVTPPARLTEGIRFDHVDFAYPSAEAAAADGDPPGTGSSGTGPSGAKSTGTGGAPRTALTDVDLVLPAGSTVAFVGDNGAGKSTLVKLLARMYDPTSGAIRIDGTPLSEIDPVAWRERVSAGFQDFASLEFLASETVGVGALASSGDRGLVDSAVDIGQARAVVSGLTKGLDTQLGTQFDGGVGLSGGQWQRLALARAFMRTSPLLMLLDEPTAALDPEAESLIYTQYGETARRLASETGAVTVLVSHRFSTVRMADLIVVVAGGRVAEVGSHAELLAKGGRYAELFDLQAKAYR